MKKSIRTKLIAVLIFSIILCIICIGTVNIVLLPSYYQNQKMTLLKDTYEEANKQYSKDEMSEEELEAATLAMDKIRENGGINLYVFNLFHIYPDSYLPEYLYPENLNSHQIMEMETLLRQYLNSYLNEVYPEEDTVENITGDIFEEDSLQDDSGMGAEEGSQKRGSRERTRKRELLYEKDEYGIYRAYDKRIDSDYMELFGTLDSGACIYLRTSYQSMDDSVRIFNKFLIFIGVGAVLLSGICMYFISRNFTNPIQKLSVIAKKMSDLDFNEKYTGKTEDEIGELGNSINILSDKLENTISRLQAANEELKKEIEAKVQIDEMRKEFLSNVSHELKTPIALIQGYAEGLLDNVTEDVESREFYCEVIVDEADKMNQMVKKLLSLNQLEFGNTPLEREDFDLTELIGSVLHNTQILTGQQDIHIVFDDREHVFVNAEEYWIEQVVTNYVSNAIHYVKGEKRIEIRILKGRELVRVEVFNTGDPIPEEELEKIWIKFYKVDKARTREYGGNGIGLSIVKAIMKMHQRECGVENREDGVMFWFEVDAVKEK